MYVKQTKTDQDNLCFHLFAVGCYFDHWGVMLVRQQEKEAFEDFLLLLHLRKWSIIYVVKHVGSSPWIWTQNRLLQIVCAQRKSSEI